jgi:endonuclease YncB( thermonuclease family)
VVDADTYQMFKGKRLFTVRLANVDAPETSQAFGSEATKQVSGLILGKTVTVDGIGKDAYNRMIATVTINGKALDSTLVVNGWAWHYKAYSHNKGLEDLQNMAIAGRKGLWKCGASKVCPPWIYRGLNSKNRAIFCSRCSE